jgi:phosphoribosylformimino-5-aminoimidazole carboxamide ribonucleotide (ProFAR) isomerase
VPFSILPALDVWHGRLVAVGSGGPRPVDAFGGDPVAAARALAGIGATALHLVDVDLALEGRPGLDVAAFRGAAPDATLQVSGGIVDLATARRLLAAGADRFVLASPALRDESGTLEVMSRGGSAAVVGLEVDGDRIRPRGSEAADEGLDLMSTVGWLAGAGAPSFLVTATSRVGGLEGPDVGVVRRVARAGRPTLAAGGIRSIDDLRALREAGAAGAIVGRAALEGRLELDAALAWAEA